MRTTEHRPTIQVTYLNGREFHRITWRGMPNVTLVWAIERHVRPGVFRGHLMARIETGQTVQQWLNAGGHPSTTNIT
jgi:hypothetical protein